MVTVPCQSAWGCFWYFPTNGKHFQALGIIFLDIFFKLLSFLEKSTTNCKLSQISKIFIIWKKLGYNSNHFWVILLWSVGPLWYGQISNFDEWYVHIPLACPWTRFLHKYKIFNDSIALRRSRVIDVKDQVCHMTFKHEKYSEYDSEVKHFQMQSAN